MWVDSDVAFDPADVDRLRAHRLPFTCGLYPKKGPRQFACEFLSDTPAVRFGVNGGLAEVRYCGFGFTHVCREVFDAVCMHHRLPTCNQRFPEPERCPAPATSALLTALSSLCKGLHHADPLCVRKAG